MERAIELFYDIGSPYSYLAATQVPRIADRTGLTVIWRPFLLGGVFKGAGNDMPGRVPAKARWMLGDLALWAKHYGVPFVFPPFFPPNTVRAMRACVAAARQGKVSEVSLALFRAYWCDGQDPSGEAAIRAAAEGAGLDGGALFAATDEPAVKDALRAATEEAVSRGAFGAPSFFLGEELFWGNDRIDLLIERTGTAGPRA